MKKINLSIIVLLCCFFYGVSQNSSNGMKYQAVARDLGGKVLPNQNITLKISLNNDQTETVYSEIHTLKTNQLGLFSIVIGEGTMKVGDFDNIPWSSNDIWMTVAIKGKGSLDFETISSSKLLAVPYAFHAMTASKLMDKSSSRTGKPTDENTDVAANVWSLFGNTSSDPANAKLGTTDAADLVIVTNNQERLRITADGELITPDGVGLNLGGNFRVRGDETQIDKDLRVGRDVWLNYNDTFSPRGQTINYGNFTVESMSSTLLTGVLNVNKDTDLDAKLNVDGITDLNEALNVNNAKKTTLTGELQVDGITNLNEALNVNNEKPTLLTGTLEVNGSMTLNDNFNVVNDNASHVASFTNTNGGNGDGIKIKLGKTHPAWDGGAYLNSPNPIAEILDDNIQTIRGYIDGSRSFDPTDPLKLIPSAWITGTACNLVAKLGEELNDALGLPVGVPALTNKTIFDAVNSFMDVIVKDSWSPDPPYTVLIPGFELPKFPETCPISGLPSLSMPNINFVNVNNSLTNSNHFIDFSDKENRALGYIRAVSVTEWGNNFFDGVYLTDFIQKTVGLDLLDAFTGAIRQFSYIVDNYNSIGVEYVSGNGDYAEWLERKNPEEVITKGDIVGVISGKISKNLVGAQQIMAVSEKPIMLGNIPEKNKENLGNNVAFMGQIPVKIMGKVNSGDYIVADISIPGYGIAKNPSEITIEDSKFIVGRSWETNLSDGPKMVNTVIGVHNGKYLKILKNFKNEIDATNNRLKSLEEKVNLINNNSSYLANN